MKKTRKLASIILCMVMFIGLLPYTKVEVNAASNVTIIGTIVKTADFYGGGISGPVYGFIPATLTQVPGVTDDLYEAGVSTFPEFGTTDLSPYVGQMKKYTGTISKFGKKEAKGPYAYCFGIKSVSDIAPGELHNSFGDMNAYAASLGFTNIPTDNIPGDALWHSIGHIDKAGGFIDYNCFETNPLSQQLTVNVMKSDYTYEFGNVQMKSWFAKSQYIQKMIAGYAKGTVKEATLKKLIG